MSDSNVLNPDFQNIDPALLSVLERLPPSKRSLLCDIVPMIDPERAQDLSLSLMLKEAVKRSRVDTILLKKLSCSFKLAFCISCLVTFFLSVVPRDKEFFLVLTELSTIAMPLLLGILCFVFLLGFFYFSSRFFYLQKVKRFINYSKKHFHYNFFKVFSIAGDSIDYTLDAIIESIFRKCGILFSVGQVNFFLEKMRSLMPTKVVDVDGTKVRVYSLSLIG